MIRTTAEVGHRSSAASRGQLRYFTDLNGQKWSGNYPFVAERPADPLQITWGFHSPRSSFAYPGGESVYA